MLFSVPAARTFIRNLSHSQAERFRHDGLGLLLR